MSIQCPERTAGTESDMEDFRFTWRKLRWWASLRQVALHVVLTALAVGIAFSLPSAARYILYQWWPLVASDASLLLVSEISLAASLVVLFNMWRLASEDRGKARVADTAALVYARHRVAPGGRSSAQAVPAEVVRRRAEDAVLKSVALQQLWGVTLGPEQLQAELDRMSAGTQAPDVLRELFAALGDDARRAAECLARPLLADRLIRSQYARDDRFHGELKARAGEELAQSGGSDDAKAFIATRAGPSTVLTLATALRVPRPR